jgi:formate hydrogenlyase subunit 3/multisubunit Na+/H+ antiporter MnhD subunit
VNLLLWGIGVILTGGAGAVLLRRWMRAADRFYGTLLVAGCILAAIPAVTVLSGAPAMAGSVSGSLPGGPWSFALDPLSAWFVLLIVFVGATAGVFGITYLAAERGHRTVAAPHAYFAVLLVALIGVVTSQAMMPFLVSWEVMALSAYLLIVFESEHAEVRRAGLVYLVLTHLSTLALIGMFAAMSVHAEGRTFADFAAGSRVGGIERTLALVLALVGFGIKAGAVPLHFWLPGAHAAAPSHASALLSGVMLKAGIYGLLRVIGLLGPAPRWYGWVLFGLGLLSGVLGVLWALAQHDLKRMLAYHSVENIGIILLGMGVGVLGVSSGQPVMAVLGFTGAVLHTMNHALYKSLLFLGAGAVVQATGTRVIDQLGGLGRRMPLTAVAFGVGSVAIVGLPPFNGFISEWVVFRGLLSSAGSHQAVRFAVLGAAGLALISGLALACFSKLDGVLFLGHARVPTRGGLDVTEPGAGMVGPMLALAAACVVIGFLPGLVLAPAQLVVASVMHTAGALAGSEEWAELATRLSTVAFGVLVIAASLMLLRGFLGRARDARTGDTWACAGQPLTPRMQYSASSYAAPLLAPFGPLAGVHDVREATAFHSHPVDPVQDGAVLPAWWALGKLTRRLRSWQGARIRWYLLLVIATLLALLYHLMKWKGVP